MKSVQSSSRCAVVSTPRSGCGTTTDSVTRGAANSAPRLSRCCLPEAVDRFEREAAPLTGTEAMVSERSGRDRAADARETGADCGTRCAVVSTPRSVRCTAMTDCVALNLWPGQRRERHDAACLKRQDRFGRRSRNACWGESDGLRAKQPASCCRGSRNRCRPAVDASRFRRSRPA